MTSNSALSPQHSALGSTQYSTAPNGEQFPLPSPQDEAAEILRLQPLVRLSYEEPKLTFDTNVGGTVNVFEAVRKTPSVKVLVNITSDKCYENREWIWGYRENDPMGGHDPYSASKGCSELVFSAYLKSFFSQTKSTRTASFPTASAP
jgi:CDP-glucose 4,6-dehydratase